MKSNNKLVKASSTLFTLVIFFILAGFPASAQEQGLSISPVVFELNSDPGDTLTNEVKIYNPTDFPQNVKMEIEDFMPVGEEGQVVLEDPGQNTTYSLASWTTISPANFTLASKEQQVVDFTIEVPQNAEPGGHYGSVVALISGATSGQTGSAVGSKRGALLLLRTSGNVKEEVAIDTFKAKTFQEYGPVTFDLKFENIGNVHVKPMGFVTITDHFGKQVAELEIPQNNVIPGAIRQANATWDKTNLIGRYTATVVASFGSTNKQTVTAVTTFTVFPWKKGLVVCGIGLIFLFILYKSRRRIGRSLKVLFGKH